MIRISIETTEPLSGSATKEDAEPLSFVGWLDLLRVLSALVSTEGHSIEERLAASQDVAGEKGISKSRTEDDTVESGTSAPVPPG